MGLFDFLFGKEPDNSPEHYLNQVPGVAKENLSPYVERGNAASNIAQGQYNRMSQNPMDVLNEILSSYNESPGYQYQQGVMGRELGNTAAAGGFAGTEEDQRQRGELVRSLLGQDMQQYLQNVLGIQGTGLQGQENTMNRGFNASGDLANILGSNLGHRADLSMQQTQQRDKNKAGILNLLTQALGAGIGGAVGGVPGAMVGSKLGSGASNLTGNYGGY